ncbi:MAG TPA: hypothetical protein GX404_09795 [Syntrophomonadaceae bacterium]|nr:hypothetical protein [Syntrophomonadaceae bacterium]
MLVNILLTIGVFVGICWYEIPSLIQEQHWRELVAFIAILLPAFVIAILQAIKVDLPQLIPTIAHYLFPILPFSTL